MIKKLKPAVRLLANLVGCKPPSFNSALEDTVVENVFKKIYEKCKNYTMTSKERMYALFKSVEYIVNAKIPGDFIECGVWKGGSVMLMAYTLMKLNETKRELWLYDTYEGMDKPTRKDYDIFKKTHALEEWIKNDKWCFSSLSEVQKNLFSTRYPKGNLVFIKGRVEDTIPKSVPRKIALLRLDTDWYQSTKHELLHLFPRLANNGVLIIDDYGYWSGCKKAVDEYFRNKPILFNRIDHTGRIALKTFKL